MAYYIGIDLGTSSLKALLVNENGEIRRAAKREYPLFFPKTGWSEQNPEDWLEALKSALSELLSGIPKEEIKAIGSGGQMHGLVALDEADRVIRPAILWNDGRTEKEVRYLNEEIGRETLAAETANIAFAGFTAPKLLWMKENEPENFARIRKIMLPKDYITYFLTGIHATDLSDASGMLLLDVKQRCWSKKMLEITGVTEEMMPKLFESYEVVGTVRQEIAEELRLPLSCKVVAGAGDNAAAAVGTGTVGEGAMNISLGTSGTLFIVSRDFKEDPHQALHAFAHADGHYHLMGCMLSAASCNQWFYENILGSADYEGLQGSIEEGDLGENHVFFLPYLMGERSPINDTLARGTFTGLTMDTSKKDMVQAVMEGVAFALRDSFEVAKKCGIQVTASKICGGGARAKIWLQMIANIFNITLLLPKTEEGPGYGGAILAMVGDGLFTDVEAAAQALLSVAGEVKPDPEIAAKYEKRYEEFSLLYPALREVFQKIGGEA